MSLVQGDLYLGDISILLGENDELVVQHGVGDHRISQIEVLEGEGESATLVKKIVI